MRQTIAASFLLLLMVVGFVHADEGSLLFLNDNGTANISSLSLRVIPGQSNVTTFRIYAQNGNLTNVALFGFSQRFNLSISPPNVSNVADGDFRLISLNVSVSNLTTAGTYAEPLIVLTSRPEQKLLPLIIDIPEATFWNVTPQVYTKNVTVNEAGMVNISFVNQGNIDISAHVSMLDLKGLTWFDQSNVAIPVGSQVSRPLYYFIGNISPGRYEVNITFVDALQQTRRTSLSFFLPDTTVPQAVVTMSPDEIYPGQRISIDIAASDDVAISAVRYRIGTGNTSTLDASEPGKYSFTIPSLPVGDHQLVVLINDSSGNMGVFNRTILVRQFEYLRAKPEVNFLKFRPRESRQMPILSSLTPTEVNVTLESLTVERTEANQNMTFQILVNSAPLDLGSTVTLQASGDVLMSIQASNLTRFSGVVRIATNADVRNPQPEIRFFGEVANYSVTPQFNLSLPGFDSYVECTPRDNGALESSLIECRSSFPVDTPKETIGVIGSPASLNSERQGYLTQLQATAEDRDGARLVNWVFVFVIIIIAAVYGVKRFYIDRTDFRG